MYIDVCVGSDDVMRMEPREGRGEVAGPGGRGERKGGREESLARLSSDERERWLY